MGPGGPTLGLSVRKKPRHLRVNLCMYLFYSFAIVYTMELFICDGATNFTRITKSGMLLGYIWEISSFTSSSTRETRTFQLKFRSGTQL